MIHIFYSFSYKDYIICIHNIKQKEYVALNEETESYRIMKNTYLKTKYTNFVGYLLKDTERIWYFLNHFLDKDSTLIKKGLERMKESAENAEIKVIYRNIYNKMFYLIIYEKQINQQLPYTILKDCIKIIQRYKRENKENIENIKVVPIVICLQKNTCHYGKMMNEKFKVTTYNNHILQLKYNLINLSEFPYMKKMQNTILEELICLNNILN